MGRGTRRPRGRGGRRPGYQWRRFTGRHHQDIRRWRRLHRAAGRERPKAGQRTVRLRGGGGCGRRRAGCCHGERRWWRRQRWVVLGRLGCRQAPWTGRAPVCGSTQGGKRWGWQWWWGRRRRRRRRGRGGGRGGGRGAAADVDEDIAIVVAAFGPGCPPLASYRGDFKRGVRDGHGVCSFFTASCGGGCSVATGSTLGATSIPTIPDSYDGEWVGDRPLGRGVLSLRAVAAAPAAPSNRFSSSIAGSGSGLAGRGGGSGGSIEGLWTEEGLAHGREKLPGKGGVYEGQYRLGKREGHGRLDLPDGSEYEGAWRNGRQNGIGTFRCGVTRHVYTGKWVGGVRCGRG
ncbi:unnamed protein product, partial [Ectocarpus sp. 13 AM-2016]